MSQSDDHSTAIVPASQRDLAVAASGDPVDSGEEIDALIGTTLHDSYSVVRFMAEGGMGRVYEAQHTRITTKRFAIKVLHAELKHSMDVRLRFRREAEAAASIDHPNVLGVHDFGYTPDGRPYLVSDYLDGRELAALLDKREPLSIALTISIARQLCRALEAAHERGVIHRDIKPANVFLVGPPHNPEVRVLDFGLSKIMELADAGVTQAGTVMGTPSYMSPEQAKGERADHRVDVYGVGAVLYACLTGRPPFEEDSPQTTVLAVITREPVRPRSIVPAIPPALEVVIQKAMAREPRDRYATMKELETALFPFTTEASVPGPASGRQNAAPAHVSDPERRSRALIDASEATGVRRRAVGWLAFGGLLLLFGALSGALGAFEVLTHSRRLLPSELALISLAVTGSLFTPGVLFVLWLKRRYWGNSARMVELVAAIRGPVLASASVYGVAALAGRVLDVASRYLPASAPTPNASGWHGWAPFLFAIGALAALAAIFRQRIVGHSTSLFRRFLGGPVLLGLIGAAGAALLLTGYRMSPRNADDAVKLFTVTPQASSPTSAHTPLPPSPATSGGSTATRAPHETDEQRPDEQKPAPAPIDHASEADLAEAIARGVPELTSLQSRYPNDPNVLKPLAFALGKEPGRSSEVLRVLDTLFTEAPGEALDVDLGKMVQVAAASATTSQRAIELMQTRMGPRGADMLFDIVLNQPEFRQRAHVALETAEVQRNLSPALKIAYDLNTAATCSAREALLPQAARDGDARTVTVLNQVTVKTVRGCGPHKNKPCPALCAKEAPAIEQTLAIIRAKLAAPKP